MNESVPVNPGAGVYIERAVGVQRERPVRRPGHEDRRQGVPVRIEIVDEHARRRRP